MDSLREFYRYDAWATGQLIDFCQSQPPELVEEVVIGTERSILHTLTHLAGSSQEYLEALVGEKVAPPILAGQMLQLRELRQRVEVLSRQWEKAVERINEFDLTLPADDPQPETPHGQDLLVLQAVQHGIDHRAQIYTTLHVLGLNPPEIDGWAYWRAEH